MEELRKTKNIFWRAQYYLTMFILEEILIIIIFHLYETTSLYSSNIHSHSLWVFRRSRAGAKIGRIG